MNVNVTITYILTKKIIIMAKQQDTRSFRIPESLMYDEIQNSKMILKTVKILNIPNPNVLEILDIFEQNNIAVYTDFKDGCTVEQALLKLETRYVPQDILDFHASWVQDSQSILEPLYKYTSDIHDSRVCRHEIVIA